MRGKLFSSAVYLITTLFIFLIVCDASGENQSGESARVLCRNPPLNGSSSEKRSDPALCQPPSKSTKRVEYVDSKTKYEDQAREHGGSALKNLASQLKQVEPLIRASIDQCSRIKKSSESEQNPLLVKLCPDLVGDGERENKSWIKQLLGIA